jgi:hypothetical protein
MAKQRQPQGRPMTLGNIRHLGVHHLIATCLSDACRHQGPIDVSKYPDDTEVPSFAPTRRSNEEGYVRLWHLADMTTAFADVRFRGKADIRKCGGNVR